MPGFRLISLGVGDAFSARWYSSCYVLEADGTRLLVDCPHPIRKILREIGDSAGIPLDIDQIAAVLLTHLHADHASGLEGFAFFSHFALDRRAIVLAHSEVARELWDAHSVGMSRMMSPDGQPQARTCDDYFDVRQLDEIAPVSFGPFSITCRRTMHPIPTYAMRISACGKRLGLSSDTSYDPALIDWLSSSDLILHETNYGLHTPYEKLAALPSDLRAKMRLVHYPDDFDLAGSMIEPLVAGRIYDI